MVALVFSVVAFLTFLVLLSSGPAAAFAFGLFLGGIAFLFCLPWIVLGNPSDHK